MLTIRTNYNTQSQILIYNDKKRTGDLDLVSIGVGMVKTDNK
jgi:hypothetical protein